MSLGLATTITVFISGFIGKNESVYLISDELLLYCCNKLSFRYTNELLTVKLIYEFINRKPQ